MIEGQHILCFGPGDWWHMNPSCTMHIMRYLAQRNRVLYVNPFSASMPRQATSGLVGRICRKLKSLSRPLRHDGSITTFSPWFLPVQGRSKSDRFNNTLIRAQLRGVCLARHFDPTMLWLENPRAADALLWYPHCFRIYHVSDAFAECPYTNAPHAIRTRDRMLTTESDVVICVSRKLWGQKRGLRAKGVFYLPHGVEFARFHHEQHHSPPDFLDGIPRPIAGYCGSLTMTNDIKLLEHCAAHAPDITFVLGGRVTAGDYSRLAALRNVHFLGQIPYESVPRFLSACDVLLMWWRMTPWIRCCSPLKLYEYLASGRPIVSVPIPQVVAEGANTISVASTAQQFLRAVRWELANDNAERARQRVAIARRRDWSAHHAQLNRILMRAMAHGLEPGAPGV